MHEVPIAVFARAPELGRVKTRLAADVGDVEALATHVALLEHALAVCAVSSRRPIELWIAGDPALPPIPELAARYTVRVHEQRGDDLGGRMRNTLRRFIDRAGAGIVVGSDIPSMAPAHLAQAAAALHGGADLVLGPSEDGGYWLIGLTTDAPTLFVDMPWGTDQVFEETLQRAARVGRVIARIATLWDVDTVADWRRYRGLKPA